MKNLVTHIRSGKSLKDIEIKKEDRKDRWGGNGKSEYHKVEGVYPYQRIKRICKAYIGKQFNKAFSEYCSQVPNYQQKFFLSEFEPNRWRSTYYVDKQGNIQKTKTRYKKERAIYYSDDYKTEKRHKVTGKPYEASMWWKKKFKEEDYEYVVVSGYALEFSSAKDPEYIRLTSDQRKRKKADARELAKEKARKTYSLITKEEKEIKEEKAKDRIKIEAKGFDYETSFRGEKQINPDVIKEKQGF